VCVLISFSIDLFLRTTTKKEQRKNISTKQNTKIFHTQKKIPNNIKYSPINTVVGGGVAFEEEEEQKTTKER
tara:strand:+ start:60 stop:275 length:216 start_codon:yes stop_codon:yes gene_type:complete